MVFIRNKNRRQRLQNVQPDDYRIYITLHIIPNKLKPHMENKISVHNIQQGTVEDTCTRVFGWICRPRSSSVVGMSHCSVTVQLNKPFTLE